MTFEHAGVMRYRHAEHLSIGYYEAADLIVQSGGSTLRAGAYPPTSPRKALSTWRSTSRVRRPARPPSPSRPITTATTCRPASGTSPTCGAPSRWLTAAPTSRAGRPVQTGARLSGHGHGGHQLRPGADGQRLRRDLCVSMVVLERPLSQVYPEIDMVTTPDGCRWPWSTATPAPQTWTPG